MFDSTLPFIATALLLAGFVLAGCYNPNAAPVGGLRGTGLFEEVRGAPRAR